MAAHIRTMGGISNEEVTALRTKLKAHYPDSTLNLSSTNFDSNYATHYGNITNLTKQYLDRQYSTAVREHIKITNQQTNRQFGGQAKPGERW